MRKLPQHLAFATRAEYCGGCGGSFKGIIKAQMEQHFLFYYQKNVSTGMGPFFCYKIASMPRADTDTISIKSSV